jgi:uncharacterized LabA/DUF88 family protein
VIKVRMKGIDVALATHLLTDAATGDCDTVVVVSNDSDLRRTLRSARRLGVRVGLINPRRRIGRDMSKSVDFYLEAPSSSYQEALFPAELSAAPGPVPRARKMVHHRSGEVRRRQGPPINGGP